MEISYIKKFVKPSLIILTISIGLIIFAFGSLLFIPSMQYRYFQSQLSGIDTIDFKVDNERELKILKNEVEILNKKVEKLIPGGSYLIINTTGNSFELYKNDQLVRKGICSTGSLIELQDGDKKKWVFETPKGVFKVRGKLIKPIWRKPDWAFAEEGLPIPSSNDPSRFESGVLGDYALSIGNGYLIHGTLYQRFLGLGVTHGCVRLNDADLEYIYNQMPVGAKVFIY